MNIKKYIVLGVLASLVLAAPGAFAQTNGSATVSAGLHLGIGRGDAMRMWPGVVGTVASVNGNTITVTTKAKVDKDNDGDGVAAKTYTVDATNAKVVKAGATSTVSAIAIGDMIMVQGTVNGTNVAATTIRDTGLPGTPKPKPTPVVTGNGQPVIAGSVSAINGSTLTITNKSNVTYTVDATNAKIVKAGVLSTLSSVTVGENVVVQGAINGTSVNAYSVIDTTASAQAKTPKGWFRGAGQFFLRLFGF